MSSATPGSARGQANDATAQTVDDDLRGLAAQFADDIVARRAVASVEVHEQQLETARRAVDAAALKAKKAQSDAAAAEAAAEQAKADLVEVEAAHAKAVKTAEAEIARMNNEAADRGEEG